MIDSRLEKEAQAESATLPEPLAGDIAAMLSAGLAYIGDRLDLFATLAEIGPVTSEGLAQAAGCHPRYIREWLEAMAVAGWVAYDRDQAHYWLPAEHIPFLVQEEHPLYLAGLLEATIPLAEEARAVLNCFRRGGGISYADHHPDMPHALGRFTAPAIHNYLTEVWLAQLLPTVHERLAAGAAVADVCCGTGQSLVEMAKAYPNSSFTGYDSDERAVRQARMRLIYEGLDGQVSVVQAGAEALGGRRYDFIIAFNMIHESVNPQTVIHDIYDALTGDGSSLLLETRRRSQVEALQNAAGHILYALSALYSLPVSLAHGGAGLGVCTGHELLQKLCAQAGFTHFQPLDFKHPFAALYVARK